MTDLRGEWSPDDEDLATTEAADRLGIGARTLERWAHDHGDVGGSTWTLADGSRRWALPRLVEWLEAQRRAGGRVGTGAGRAGALPVAAGASPGERARDQVPEELRARLRAVRTREELAALYREVMDLTLTGRLAPTTAQALARLTADLGNLLEEQARAGAVPEALVSAEAVLLAQLFEGLASGRRRAELLERARALAAEDALEFPAERPAEAAAALAAAGLDAFGAPLPEVDGGEEEGDDEGPGPERGGPGAHPPGPAPARDPAGPAPGGPAQRPPAP